MGIVAATPTGRARPCSWSATPSPSAPAWRTRRCGPRDSRARYAGNPALAALQVVNASHPGHGPEHQVVFLRRVLEAHRVDAVLVRVAVGQRNFRVPPPAELAREITAAQWRERLRSVTKFVPFLYNKFEAQIPRMRAALVPAPLRKRPAPGGADRSPAAGRAAWRDGRTAWEEMVRLTACDDIPITFVVHDATGRPAAVALAESLGDLADAGGRVHVLRLGPEAFGLENREGAEVRQILRETLTLGRDPHANPRQHQLIADALSTGLEGAGVTGRLSDRAAPGAAGGDPAARRECLRSAAAAR